MFTPKYIKEIERRIEEERYATLVYVSHTNKEVKCLFPWDCKCGGEFTANLPVLEPMGNGAIVCPDCSNSEKFKYCNLFLN